jgi:NTE family protein
MTNHSKTAFVFAGGGSLGAVQVGMLKALQAARIEPELVAGVSVGSINAYCFACQPDAQGLAFLERLWRRLRRSDVFPSPGMLGLLQILGGRNHLVRPDGLARLLRQQLPSSDLGATRIPCHVTATDALTGMSVTLSRGPAAPALLASAAIPAIFPPVSIGGRALIDGGFAHQAPFEAVVAAGATRLYVLPTGYSCARPKVPASALGAALNALNMLTVSKLTGSIRHYAAQVEVHVVPPLCPLDVTPLDFRQTGALIDRAESQTAEWLSRGAGKDELVPPQLVPHVHA